MNNVVIIHFLNISADIGLLRLDILVELIKIHEATHDSCFVVVEKLHVFEAVIETPVITACNNNFGHFGRILGKADKLTEAINVS
jgi:hypothetical protein